MGIDSWEPALALARKNLAQGGVAGRVELRSQRLEHLDDEKVFTLAWLPGPFIAVEIVAIALKRIYRARAPGGWLIFGLYLRPPDKLGQALTDLRIVRGGGHPWTTAEVEQQLEATGFERIETSLSLGSAFRNISVGAKKEIWCRGNEFVNESVERRAAIGGTS